MNASAPRRIHYLDSIRGIAAMMVVVYHFMGWHGEDDHRYHIASLLFNGSDAVSFFFVLSGFALSYKYLNREAEVTLIPYTIKRILRLYPAYIVVVLANYIYTKYGWSFSQMASDVFWNNESHIWEELSMMRHNHKYYTPGWTLGVEMALSLVMPLLVIVARFRIKMIWWFIPIIVFIGPYYISSFAVHFCLGILISYYYMDLCSYDSKNSKWYPYRWLIVLLVFLIFSLRHIMRLVPFGPETEFANNLIKVDYFLPTGIASAAIIVLVILSKRMQNVLHNQALLFLGKISYSVYLVHWLIVAHVMINKDHYFAYFNNSETAFFVLLACVLIGTTVFAFLLYHLVEEPFMKLGRRLEKRWKGID